MRGNIVEFPRYDYSASVARGLGAIHGVTRQWPA